LPDADARRAAYARYEALPAPVPSGRKWKHDLRKADFSAFSLPLADTEIAAGDFALPAGVSAAAVALQIDGAVAIHGVSDALRARGVVVCDFATARREHAATFAAAFTSALLPSDKYGQLVRAFHTNGIFIHVPAGVTIDEPIAVALGSLLGDSMPYVVVSAGESAHLGIVEYGIARSADRYAIANIEIVAAAGSRVSYTALQENGPATQAIATRRARLGAGAHLAWQIAELGSALSTDTIVTKLDGEGASVDLAALFFATGDQHVDITTEVLHDVPHTKSETVVKSAARDHAQARFLGNIKIIKNAHGTEASLRDDTLLLSEGAHIDSIPALEIAANDVKAFHGATVGALDQEHIFYIMSRGIDRVAAEQLVALGFFEPAIARFPSEQLRDYVRTTLSAKVTA
jgi:Fe-S cluster assembly protein SufD